MPAGALAGTAAIAGIGATEFSKDSGRSELRLAVEAITSALADAGLAAADVDGLVTFSMDGNAEIAVARELGLRELRFFSQIGYGGGAACATVQHAAMAVATGTAEVVVCYRALNERSGRRFGQVAAGLAGQLTTAGIDNGWHYPMGLATPAATVAMIARRYMHDYGATSEDFGRVTVADRRHAASNPKAWFFERPITLAEHQKSRWIAEPLRLLDCCQESDGAVAVVVTSIDRARELPWRPAVIAAAAQGSGPDQYVMTSYYRDDPAALPEMGVVARQLWRQAGLGPAEVRTAVLYDHFTPYVLIQLEELGFCARGEAREFIADGAIELGGRLPLNPHGGQLGEAYIHGMNGIAEAVRQVRGTSVNQVPGDGPVLVTAGTGVPTSGLLLSLPALRPRPSRQPAVGQRSFGRFTTAVSRWRPSAALVPHKSDIILIDGSDGRRHSSREVSPMRATNESPTPPRSLLMKISVRSWEYRNPRLLWHGRLAVGLICLGIGAVLLAYGYWWGLLALAGAAVAILGGYRIYQITRSRPAA